MSFVTLGGDGGLRPTYFELVAADRLLAGLKSAISYSLGVTAQRRPFVHRILDWEDELFLALHFLLDRHSLSAYSASFADSLYGLRRAARTSKGAAKEGPKLLSPSQQRAALALLVSLPYVGAKVQALYHRHSSDPPTDRQTQEGWRQAARRLALALFLRVWPFTHAVWEGLRFTYQLLYLLDGTSYYSPTLHLLGQRIIRVTGQELAEAEQLKWRRRNAQLGRAAAGPWLLSWPWAACLRLGFAAMDHTRNALILSAFGFKLLEWWYLSGSEKLASQKQLPPPAPPAPVAPSPSGVPLPADRSLCPLCSRARTNPAMATVSGFVFCYPCLFNHLTQSPCCPVTRIPMSLDNVRRLYQTA